MRRKFATTHDRYEMEELLRLNEERGLLPDESERLELLMQLTRTPNYGWVRYGLDGQYVDTAPKLDRMKEAPLIFGRRTQAAKPSKPKKAKKVEVRSDQISLFPLEQSYA